MPAPASPDHDAAFWPTGDFVRLFEADLVGAPRWFQAIWLNRPQVFEEQMRTDDLDGGEYRGRTPLEWAVRLGRLAIARGLLARPFEVDRAGTWLRESLADSLASKPPQGVWRALVRAGVPVQASHLAAAAGRCDEAGDRFYRRHAKGVLGPLGPAFFLLPPLGASLPVQPLPSRTFARALSLSGPRQRPLPGSMMRVARQWVGALHRASPWSKDPLPASLDALSALVRHWDEPGASLVQILVQMAQWEPAFGKSKSKDSFFRFPEPARKDAVVSAWIQSVADHWGGPALEVPPDSLAVLVQAGPRSAHALLGSPAFAPPSSPEKAPAASFALAGWMEEVSILAGRAEQDAQAEMGDALCQWARSLPSRWGLAFAASQAQEWALEGPGQDGPQGAAFLEGLFEWWDPSPAARQALWVRLARKWVHATAPACELGLVQAALLDKGFSPQQGLEAILAQMRRFPSTPGRLEEAVEGAFQALLGAGATWHLPSAQKALAALGTEGEGFLSKTDRIVLAKWKLDGALEPAPAPSCRSSRRL